MCSLFCFFLTSSLFLLVSTVQAMKHVDKVESLVRLSANVVVKQIDELDLNDNKQIKYFKGLGEKIPSELERMIVAGAIQPFLVPFSNKLCECGFLSKSRPCLKVDGYKIFFKLIEESINFSNAIFIREENECSFLKINNQFFDVSCQYPENHKSVAVFTFIQSFEGGDWQGGLSGLYYVDRDSGYNGKKSMYQAVDRSSHVISIIDKTNGAILQTYSHPNNAIFSFLHEKVNFLYLILTFSFVQGSKEGRYPILRAERDPKILEKINLATLITLKQIAQYKQLTLTQFQEQQSELFTEYEKLDNNIKKIVKLKPECKASNERT